MHELLHTHQLLNSSELEAPSMRFTKNVMEEISRYHVAPATKSYINKNIIRGIGAFFLTMIAGLFVYVLAQFKWSGGSRQRRLHVWPLNAPALRRQPRTGKDRLLKGVQQHLGHRLYADRRGHGLDAAGHVPAAEEEPVRQTILMSTNP